MGKPDIVESPEFLGTVKQSAFILCPVLCNASPGAWNYGKKRGI